MNASAEEVQCIIHDGAPHETYLLDLWVSIQQIPGSGLRTGHLCRLPGVEAARGIKKYDVCGLSGS